MEQFLEIYYRACMSFFKKIVDNNSGPVWLVTKEDRRDVLAQWLRKGAQQYSQNFLSILQYKRQ